jgi:hypothetical protein
MDLLIEKVPLHTLVDHVSFWLVKVEGIFVRMKVGWREMNDPLSKRGVQGIVAILVMRDMARVHNRPTGATRVCSVLVL